MPHEYKTLLIDGNSIFRRGYYGAKDMFNWKGEHIGGLYQFLVFLRNFLNSDLFKKVYVFWDGEDSHSLRRGFLPSYKMNREYPYYHDDRGLLTKDDLILERYKVKEYLEELFIRQFECEGMEGDDLIGYYCKRKDENEHITICSADRDMIQLISDDVSLYLTDKRLLLDREGFYEEFGYIPENELLIKCFHGDNSDGIKGLKGVGRKTLFKHFPDLKNKVLRPEQIKEQIFEIQGQRENNKNKRLKTLDKIKEFIDDENGFQVNKKIMNLEDPFITNECKEEVDELFYLPLDAEGRDIKNFYRKLKRDGLDETFNKGYLDFLIPFKELIEREKKNYMSNQKLNDHE